MKLLNAKPQETLMVGDWAERDVLGAASVGMKTVWAKYGNEFSTPHSGADYEVEDIYDLVGIIKKANALNN
ncbi:MAG: HAD hydrolase-like protein [Elusimicrobia bacterium]|nr:HAD hydrolase-like protein [Elusimicrobiota bacterium]